MTPGAPSWPCTAAPSNFKAPARADQRCAWAEKPEPLPHNLFQIDPLTGNRRAWSPATACCWSAGPPDPARAVDAPRRARARRNAPVHVAERAVGDHALRRAGASPTRTIHWSRYDVWSQPHPRAAHGSDPDLRARGRFTAQPGLAPTVGAIIRAWTSGPGRSSGCPFTSLAVCPCTRSYPLETIPDAPTAPGRVPPRFLASQSIAMVCPCVSDDRACATRSVKREGPRTGRRPKLHGGQHPGVSSTPPWRRAVRRSSPISGRRKAPLLLMRGGARGRPPAPTKYGLSRPWRLNHGSSAEQPAESLSRLVRR